MISVQSLCHLDRCAGVASTLDMGTDLGRAVVAWNASTRAAVT